MMVHVVCDISPILWGDAVPETPLLHMRISDICCNIWTYTSPCSLSMQTLACRRGVTFHDGTPWDANACKANFDQIFDPALINYHGWYDLPRRAKSWEVRAMQPTLVALRLLRL
jgi:hypothetical protein